MPGRCEGARVHLRSQVSSAPPHVGDTAVRAAARVMGKPWVNDMYNIPPTQSMLTVTHFKFHILTGTTRVSCFTNRDNLAVPFDVYRNRSIYYSSTLIGRLFETIPLQNSGVSLGM